MLQLLHAVRSLMLGKIIEVGELHLLSLVIKLTFIGNISNVIFSSFGLIMAND